MFSTGFKAHVDFLRSCSSFYVHRFLYEIHNIIYGLYLKMNYISFVDRYVTKRDVCFQLASTIYVRQKIQPMNPYASNWLERLRRIRQMREKLCAERAKSEGSVDIRSFVSSSKPVAGDDFSDFVK